MHKEESRRGWTRTQLISLVGLAALFVSTSTGVIVGFTEQGAAIKEHEKKIIKLEAQSAVVTEVKILVATIKESMRENRLAWQVLVKKSDDADRKFEQKLISFQLDLGEIKNQLKNKMHKEKISYQEPK